MNMRLALKDLTMVYQNVLLSGNFLITSRCPSPASLVFVDCVKHLWTASVL
jgi:hypothetical protein